MAETDLNLSVVARQCGVGSAARLTVLFKQVTGYQPSLFRRAAGNRSNQGAESALLC